MHIDLVSVQDPAACAEGLVAANWSLPFQFVSEELLPSVASVEIVGRAFPRVSSSCILLLF